MSSVATYEDGWKCVMYVHVHVHDTHICYLLLSNQNFKGAYLEAEVVEEVIGWLGLVGTATANKFVTRS